MIQHYTHDKVRRPLTPMTNTILYNRSLFWFRRDLRDYDNTGLAAALNNSNEVFCVFIFDRKILDELSTKQDRRVDFIHQSISELAHSLEKKGGALIVRYGDAVEEIKKLVSELNIEAVFTNKDYEPFAYQRDETVETLLQDQDIKFHHYKDQVIFEEKEILNKSGKPFTVFTPYKNAWLKRVSGDDLLVRDSDKLAHRLSNETKEKILSLKEIGFEKTNVSEILPAGMGGAQKLFDDFQSRMHSYKKARDFPAVKGVSYLSVHQRFGTISIRELVRAALSEHNQGGETWLSELIWREFYFQILANFPHVVKSAFKPQYDSLRWENDKQLFKAWCNGETGYPLVDAAMKQINQTGYMHNRLRMVTASFLTKDLLIDWHWGEKYFADHLNDYDLAANNGGWQWAASTGCDPQPYFRIFNPITQSEKFDPQGKFIRRYLPILKNVPDKYIHAPWTMPIKEQKSIDMLIGRDYPMPIVDHSEARNKALMLYQEVRSSKE